MFISFISMCNIVHFIPFKKDILFCLFFFSLFLFNEKLHVLFNMSKNGVKNKQKTISIIDTFFSSEHKSYELNKIFQLNQSMITISIDLVIKRKKFRAIHFRAIFCMKISKYWKFQLGIDKYTVWILPEKSKMCVSSGLI